MLLTLLLAVFASGDAVWIDTLARAERERKPVVVLFRTAECERCDEFESRTLPHPAIQRRLPAVVFATRFVAAGEDPHVALFDRQGRLHARWPMVPDTTNFAIILDSVAVVAPHFERAVQFGDTPEGALQIGVALTKLGRAAAARPHLERARNEGTGDTRDAAVALFETLDGKSEMPRVAAKGTIRILPLERQLVSGRQLVRTHVASAAVARVTFSLDGREVARVEKPPFSATLDFGAVPERHTIRVAAFDRKGGDLGTHERVVNEAGETFWLRLASPREGRAGGAVRVSMNVRVPAGHRVRRVVVSWNDAERAVLTEAPWEATIEIPPDHTGVLRAVAELDDGRTSEDAVLLNARGAVEHASVQLVELPITVIGSADFTPDRIRVREGDTVRRVESIATAAETPLTVGLLLDISESMQKAMPDAQEAAIRFLETVLGERDRAFLVTFNTRARLVQPATSDLDLLRRGITATRPDGVTALHDALILGMLQFEGIKGRRAMIVFTDGLDVTSESSAADVRELARRVNVPIHVITMPLPRIAIDSRNDALQRIAPATGGTSHTLDDLSAIGTIYARIEAALRAQILAFIRTDPATRENEWRSVKVEIDGAQVHAPEGYYATW
ncbi:MAG TPA: VWA domain-containing protein [Thermoanaerobaculia bacterium]|nr:VWA domain-containing protein [Thermoanaerobaculia bacterium]